MITDLRKRFIFAAMSSTFGVLFVIMSILNIANYSRMVSRADETLAELAKNDGEFDSREFERIPPDNGDSQVLSDEKYISGGGNLGDIHPPDKPDKSSDDRFSPETPFQTRYFSVVVNDGEVVSSSLDNIAAIDESEAEAYALQVIDDDSDGGFADIYRYKVVSGTDGDRVRRIDGLHPHCAVRNWNHLKIHLYIVSGCRSSALLLFFCLCCSGQRRYSDLLLRVMINRNGL